MSLNEEEKTRPASDFEIEEFLEDARSKLNTRLGRDSATDFPDVVLRRYLAHVGTGDLERMTVDEVTEAAAATAEDRLRRRPGSGSPEAGARAMHDDPVGIALDKRRFDALASEIATIEDAFQKALAAAKGVGRPRRG